MSTKLDYSDRLIFKFIMIGCIVYTVFDVFYSSFAFIGSAITVFGTLYVLWAKFGQFLGFYDGMHFFEYDKFGDFVSNKKIPVGRGIDAIMVIVNSYLSFSVLLLFYSVIACLSAWMGDSVFGSLCFLILFIILVVKNTRSSYWIKQTDPYWSDFSFSWIQVIFSGLFTAAIVINSAVLSCILLLIVVVSYFIVLKYYTGFLISSDVKYIYSVEKRLCIEITLTDGTVYNSANEKFYVIMQNNGDLLICSKSEGKLSVRDRTFQKIKGDLRHVDKRCLREIVINSL